MGEWYKRARVRAESVADLRQAGYAEADAFRNRPDHLDLMTECSDAGPNSEAVSASLLLKWLRISPPVTASRGSGDAIRLTSMSNWTSTGHFI